MFPVVRHARYLTVPLLARAHALFNTPMCVQWARDDCVGTSSVYVCACAGFNWYIQEHVTLAMVILCCTQPAGRRPAVYSVLPAH